MSKLYLEDFSGDQVNIDSDQVYMVIIEGSVIIIIYKNATSERFPASPENINVAMDLIRAVKKIRATP